MKANITMVTSGKGGAGKTTVSACLAGSLAGLGKKVLLIELDMGLRSLDILLNVQNKVVFDIIDILKGRCEIEQAIISVDNIPNLYLLSASVNPGVILCKENLHSLCEFLCLQYDNIIIDTPAGIGEGFNAAAFVADLALVVVTPDPVCIRDAASISAMLEKGYVIDQRLLINRVAPDFVKYKVIPDLDAVIDMVGVQLIGVIPESKHVYKLSLGGEFLPSDCSAAKAFKAVAIRLCGKEADLVIR